MIENRYSVFININGCPNHIFSFCVDKKWQNNFSLREKNCQRTSNFELDFLSVISIKWSSLVIELNEVSGFVEMNALVKRSALARHYDPNPIFQSESITDSQCSGQPRCLNVNWEAAVSFRIQTGLHDLIHGLTKGWQRKPPEWKLAGRVEMILLLFQAPFTPSVLHYPIMFTAK